MDPELQVRLLAEFEEGVHHFILISPPCSTFSRARMANRMGPPAIRSKVHPWGFPWLKAKDKKVCEKANSLIMFAFAVMEAASKALQRGHRIAVVFEHPVDLGSYSLGTPASVFQLERLRGVVKNQAWSTFAFHQCDFKALSSKPTRLVTNVGALSSFKGWPVFDKNDNYLGPLPKSCGHLHEPLVDAAGKSKDRLTDSAAYPAELNKWLAEQVVIWLSRLLRVGRSLHWA